MSTFSAQLADAITKAKGNMDKVVRKVVLDIGTRVIEKTPVGDPSIWQSPPPPGYVGGRARANWQYGNTSRGMPTSDLPDIDKSGQVSVNRIQAGVQSSETAVVHYIVNNLPYAQRLEDGWSTQAPAGMVGLTVLEFEGVVNKTANEVNR